MSNLRDVFLKPSAESKPWIPIIVTAALSGLGGALVKDYVPALYSFADGFVPRAYNFTVFLNKSKYVNDVSESYIQVRDSKMSEVIIESRKFDQNFILTDTFSARPGSVFLTAWVKYKNDLYYLAQQVNLSKEFSQSFEFDPEKWTKAGVGLPPKEAEDPKKYPVKPEETQLPSGQIPPWLRVAYQELGVSETPNSDSNPRIIEYLQASGVKRSPSETTDWSAAFVNWALAHAGVSGSNSLINRDFLKWGTPAISPVVGCIAVFWRISPSSPTGHAGFYIGESGDRVLIIGGNQNNSVSVGSIPKSQFLGCRLPS